MYQDILYAGPQLHKAGALLNFLTPNSKISWVRH